MPAQSALTEKATLGKTAEPPVRAARWQGRHQVMLVPLLIFLAVFFAYPLLDTFLRSIGAPDQPFTLAHYRRVIDRPVYLRLFQITFEIAFSTSAVTLFLGYPVAYLMTRARPRALSLCLVCVLTPFFTSVLVRTYAWMVILSPEGVLNQSLAKLGLGRVELIYNRPGVLIAMTYTLLPYMVLTLYSVFRGIDLKLFLAAYNLGASDWQVFHRVFLPLSLPGVAGGFLLVFILGLGYFITPSLMGGPGDQMVAMVIYEQVERTLNWHFASALSIILLVVTLAGFLLYDRVVGLRTLLESKF
ncbi:MAG: ABC transporter permease [Candidatus Rokubacteria bacterium]|nr:ABC transporter permease [Candidatus Rokubacteria bacterium]